jgi:hypothetical protein
LTHENLQLKKRLDDHDLATKNSNTKISNLENCVAQLETQLTDAIKVKLKYFLH